MKILYLGAHPDDVEVGCGGTIVRYKNDEQMVAVFSHCDTHSGLNIDGNQLSQEFLNSMQILGVKNFQQFNFENTRFPDQSHDIRDMIEFLKQMFKPDIVYFPSLNDQHQDHATLAKECLRAFRRGREELRSYELSTSLQFNPNIYIDIEATIDKKIEALYCYQSQFARKQHNENLWRARAIMRAIQVGLNYVEAFELIRRCEYGEESREAEMDKRTE